MLSKTVISCLKLQSITRCFVTICDKLFEVVAKCDNLSQVIKLFQSRRRRAYLTVISRSRKMKCEVYHRYGGCGGVTRTRQVAFMEIFGYKQLVQYAPTLVWARISGQTFVRLGHICPGDTCPGKDRYKSQLQRATTTLSPNLGGPYIGGFGPGHLT